MISTIKYDYAEQTGKKLSIKTIVEQLMDEHFEIRGGNSAKCLHGYISKTFDFSEEE